MADATVQYVDDVREPETKPVFPERHASVARRIAELSTEMQQWRLRFRQEGDLYGLPHDPEDPYFRTLAIHDHLREIDKLLAAMKRDYDAEMATAKVRAAQYDPECWRKSTGKRIHPRRVPLAGWVKAMARAWRAAGITVSDEPAGVFVSFMTALHGSLPQDVRKRSPLTPDAVRYARRFG